MVVALFFLHLPCIIHVSGQYLNYSVSFGFSGFQNNPSFWLNGSLSPKSLIVRVMACVYKVWFCSNILIFLIGSYVLWMT